MKLFSQVRRTGAFARPVLPSLIVVFLAASVAVAQKGERSRVTDSILGVRIGASLDYAHEKLDRLSASTVPKRGEAEASGEQSEREGGRKEAWKLKGTDYETVILQADQEGRVVWITGWLRPGKEIPFAKLGSLSSATNVTDLRVIWNVDTPNGGYRLVVKGQNGKARVITLLSLGATPMR